MAVCLNSEHPAARQLAVKYCKDHPDGLPCTDLSAKSLADIAADHGPSVVRTEASRRGEMREVPAALVSCALGKELSPAANLTCIRSHYELEVGDSHHLAQAYASRYPRDIAAKEMTETMQKYHSVAVLYQDMWSHGLEMPPLSELESSMQPPVTARELLDNAGAVAEYWAYTSGAKQIYELTSLVSPELRGIYVEPWRASMYVYFKGQRFTFPLEGGIEVVRTLNQLLEDRGSKRRIFLTAGSVGPAAIAGSREGMKWLFGEGLLIRAE
jgi:hypothetical protein